MKLANLLNEFPFYKSNGPIDDITIKNIKVDHRKVNKGDLYICIDGFTVDGHDFAQHAIDNGALVVVTEKYLSLSECTIITVRDTKRALAIFAAKFYQYPTNSLFLIGITGTNGKTTITNLLDAIFTEHHMNGAIIGTIHAKYHENIIQLKNTTPDALILQQLFHQMITEKINVVSMEVSSHALDIGRVNGCNFDIALMTNISQDHLDYHGNMENYVKAKSLLFSRLGNHYSSENNKFAVINKDDSYADYFQYSTSQQVVTYGFHQHADVRATNIKLSKNKMLFTVVTPHGKLEINSHLIGKFNIYNLLAATTVGMLMKIPPLTIKKALESVTGIDGRMEQVNIGQSFSVIVDYAHTPDSLKNVLSTIQEFANKRVIVVVGAGGDRDRYKRPLMAKIALKYSDLAIFTSDNPRTENPEQILNDMTKDLEDENFIRIENRKGAIRRGIQLAQDGDVVLIAGKGHETYQEINGERFHFDDRIIAKEAIELKE